MKNHTAVTISFQKRKNPSTFIMLAVCFIIEITAVIAVISPVQAAVPQPDIKRLIILEAKKSPNVSASLALAVAHVESHFKSNAVSPKGAIGVMQIMPRTGRDVFGLTSQQLHDPQTNIRAGIAFLGQLIEQYDGRIDLALSHYNGGSAVSKNGKKRIIPYTRGYVLKVLAAAQTYAAKKNSLTPKTRQEPPFDTPYIQAQSHWQTNDGNHSGDGKATIRGGDISGDLRQVDFWLDAANATRKGKVRYMVSSPSARLIAQMTENRRHFRNRLRQHQ